MRRNAHAYSLNRPPTRPDDPVPQSSETRLRLPGIGAEDFEVGDAGSISLSQHLDYRVGITSVGYGGNSCSVAQLQALPGCLKKFTRCTGGFQLAQPPDPGRKLALVYLFREAGEFQMGMGIDQPRDDDSLAKLLDRGVWRPRHY
jgi:hypothetical protein